MYKIRTPLYPPASGGKHRVLRYPTRQGKEFASSQSSEQKEQFPTACGGARGGNPAPIKQQSSLSLEGEQEIQFSQPLARGLGRVNLTPIENLQPGDWVLSHTGKPRRIRRVIRKPYSGQLIGIQHVQSPTTLWVTADHYIRCKQRILSYGKERAWSEVPSSHFGRARELRREMTSG